MPFHNDWIIPSYDIMSKIQSKLDNRQAMVDSIKRKIDDLGIITRSKTNEHQRLESELDEATRLLNSQKDFQNRYNEDFRIIKSETEEFGWRYPTWAEWPRDADLFQREASNAYFAKRDIMSFGRVY